MDIKHEKKESTGRFYIKEGSKMLAEMDYHLPVKNTMLIVHTEVDESLSGKGVGKSLVVAAVEYARANSILLNATCPFAKKILDRTPEFADVYHAEKK